MRRTLAATCMIASASLAAAVPARAGLEVSAVEAVPRLDLRARAGDPVDEELRVQQAELSLRFSVGDGRKELGSFALQGNLETSMTGRARQMHGGSFPHGNLYAVANLGVARPKLKLGQFVVPFGTLAEYDTHGIPLQTPYPRTLGIRLDRGAALEGFAGEWDWWLSATSGDGRNRHEGGSALVLRLARDRELGDDFLRIGVSALVGTNMPVFPTNPMSVPMGMDDMVTLAEACFRRDKRRLAVDVDWLHGIDNIRAELVAGTDDGRWVGGSVLPHGEWLYYNHPFSYQTDLTLQADRWQQADGTAYGLGVQVHHRLDDWSGLRLSYEPRWADPSEGASVSADVLTFQYYREYAWTPAF